MVNVRHKKKNRGQLLIAKARPQTANKIPKSKHHAENSRFDSSYSYQVLSMTFKLLNSSIAYSIVGICIGIDHLVDILYNKVPHS